MKSFLFIFLSSTAFLIAEPASPAEQLLKTTRYEELTVDSAMATFDAMTKQMATQGVPAAAIVEIRNEARQMYARIFTGPEIRKKMIELYNKHYTEGEIIELNGFYQTPLGQKTLAVMPAIMSEAMQMAMPTVQAEMPDFQKKVAAIVEKHKKPTE